MKKYVLSVVVVLCGLIFTSVYRNDSFSEKLLSLSYWNQKSGIQLNNAIITTFFKKYPDLKKHQSDLLSLYKSRKYAPVWFSKNRLIPLAETLYTKANSLHEEGITIQIVYKEQFEAIFSSNSQLTPIDTELLLSSLYLFYAKNVFYGIDAEKFKTLGWFIPRKTVSYKSLLDSLLLNPEILNKNENMQLDQYYKLKAVLKKYREIAKNGDWQPIPADSSTLEYHPNDTSETIRQIRHRLVVMGDLKNDSKSNIYDTEMKAAVLQYKKRNGYTLNYEITKSHIYVMNIPIEKYIQTIIVNMERCRWISPELTKADEYILINVPSYKLSYIKNGETALESNVFTGKSITETVIFSSAISQIVFNPYWIIPKSIVEDELSIAMAKDKDYLKTHNMEWRNGTLRQKPGGTNPMGKMKFLFPNAYAIYLHDSPSKSLFESEYRALSHGCINMNKAKELALLLLKDDPDWPVDRMENILKGNKETLCTLKKKTPIHLIYFTAWVNDSGEIGFYNDIYEKDNYLAKLLAAEK